MLQAATCTLIAVYEAAYHDPRDKATCPSEPATRSREPKEDVVSRRLSHASIPQPTFYPTQQSRGPPRAQERGTSEEPSVRTFKTGDNFTT